ncbi:MAG: signal peptidase II [Actinobacteria bacterium]|nr:signal peptidase II [Actinomycetota bacterium]
MVEPGSLASDRNGARRRRARKRLLTAGIVVVVVAIDQVTKSIAEKDLTHPIHLVGPLGLGLTYNSGTAFSLFTGNPVVLSAVVAVMIVLLALMVFWAKRTSTAVCLGLILGGGSWKHIGPIFRSHHGAVVDFITFTHWPTFNVADSSITVGVVLLLVLQWRQSRHAPSEGNDDDRS